LYISYGTHTDRGKVRESNEDSYAANAKNRLFLVADGMGGHAAGEIASSIAASTVEEYVALRHSSPLAPRDILQLAVREANTRIYHTQLDRAEFAGMGSTLTAILLRNGKYYVAHVGDSRAYLLRDGVLRQITRDHSVVWDLLEKGLIEKKDLSGHPKKNLITRSIGPHPQVEIDMEAGDVQAGDVYLLCSDGLTDVVADENLGRLLSGSRGTPQQLSEDLVEAANRAGSPDNITAVVLRIEDAESDNGDTGKIILR